MTTPQPQKESELVYAQAQKAISQGDYALAQELLNKLLGLYELTKDLETYTCYARALVRFNERKGLEAYNSMVIDKGLPFIPTDEKNLTFYADYAYFLSRMRYRIRLDSRQMNEQAYKIAKAIYNAKNTLDAEVYTHVLFVFFEYEAPELHEAMQQKNIITQFFQMNLAGLNGDDSKVIEIFNILAKDYDKEWCKRQTLKNLTQAINDFYGPFNISYELSHGSSPKPAPLAGVLTNIDKSRISRSLAAVGDIIYNSHIASVAKIPGKQREFDLDKIFAERLDVFRELSNR